MKTLRLGLATLFVILVGTGAWSWYALPGRTPPGPTPGHAGETLKFPKHFLWGVATAGQQIESQQPSDWTAFEQDVYAHQRFAAGPALGTTVPGNIRNLGNWSETVRSRKTGFDTLYPQDMAMAAGLGINAFRLSFDWARLFPRPGMAAPDPAGIAYYKGVLAEMKRNHITPFVTLFHVATPDWWWQPDADGRKGWERADAMQGWQAYVSAVADAFIPDVEYWCTLNEPMVSVYSGYLEGSYPPLEKRAGVAAVSGVIEGMLRAHAIAYQTLHKVAAERQAPVTVGLTQAVMHVVPLRNWAPLDRLTARYIDQAWNWDFLDAVQTGRMKLTDTDIDREIPDLKGSEDYVGLNYYMRMYVESDIANPSAPKVMNRDPDAPGEAVNDLGWVIDPHGFYEILTRAGDRYRKPIYVLENGTADHAADDVTRQKYLVAHLRELWLAIDHGADIRSFMEWSLIDNFEWVEGFDAGFGLVAVDYEHDFKRTPRPSAQLYADIIHAGCLPDALVQRYGAMAYPGR
jgi:beta-glucosidase